MVSSDPLNAEQQLSSAPLEIEVFLSGVVFGPFTEPKIKERISEGLVALDDKARLTGSTDWIALEDLLTQLPPESSLKQAPLVEPAINDHAAPESDSNSSTKSETPSLDVPPEPALPSLPAVQDSPPPQVSTATRPIGINRISSGPLPSSLRTTSISGGRPRTGTLPSSSSSATGSGPLRGIRSQILAHSSKEPPKGFSRSVASRTAMLHLPTRTTTGPLSPVKKPVLKDTFPVTSAEPPPPEKPAPIAPEAVKTEFLAPIAPEPPRGLQFRASRTRLEENPKPAEKASSLDISAVPVATPALLPEASPASTLVEVAAPLTHDPLPAESSEPAQTPAAALSPPAAEQPRNTLASRSVPANSTGTGTLPRTRPATIVLPPKSTEKRPGITPGLSVRLPARRTQVIKAMPGVAVTGPQSKSESVPIGNPSSLQPLTVASETSFEPKLPSEPKFAPLPSRSSLSQTSAAAPETATKAFTSPLPAPTRSVPVKAGKTPPDPLENTLSSLPKAAKNPIRRGGMADASALAATTLLSPAAKLPNLPTKATPHVNAEETPLPEQGVHGPPKVISLPEKEEDDEATPVARVALVEERRAALRQTRLRRKQISLALGLLGLLLVAALGYGIYYYAVSGPSATNTAAPEQQAPAPPAANHANALPALKTTQTPSSATSILPPHGPPEDPEVAMHISQGKAAQARGDLDGAMSEFTQALLLDPRNVAALSFRAALKESRSDFDGAIADDNQLLALDPHNAAGFCQRGFVKQSRGDLDGALADYSRAIQLDPSSFTSYYNRGMIQEQKGDSLSAIADYNRALELNPQLAGAFYNRGNAKMDRADFDGAIADYTHALQINPKIALASCNRALAEQNLGNLDAALPDYNQAIAQDSHIAIAYYNRGLIKEQQRDFAGCIADSTKALELDPNNAQAYYNRGVALQAKGNLDAAANDLRKFSELAPKNIYADYAHLYLWVIGTQQSRKPQADQELSTALDSNWNAEPEQLASKIAGFLLDHVSEGDLIAVAASTDSKKAQGQHCEVWYFDGIKKMLVGDKIAAINCFHQCVNTGQKDYCEFILAEAQLENLAQTKA